MTTDRNSFCVAIDGPSSSGKSTVAKGVAGELGFFHIDSGAIYRALAWWMDRCGGNCDDFPYHVEVREGKCHHFVGEREVTQEIRAPQMSQRSSEIAVLPEVRRCVNELQREIAKNKSVVIEGRDIGSVVFPYAQVKIFLTANAEERVKRRFQELRAKGVETTLDEVRHDLAERDERDRTRKDAPLIQAKDAHVVDTTDLTPEEVVQVIVSLAQTHQTRPGIVYRIARGFFLALFRLLYRFEVRGVEHYPKGAAIIAPNHTSFFDPPAVGVACPGEVHSMANAYLFRNPIMKWLMPRLNSHPVASGVGDLETLKKITVLLMEGKKVIIFPEGTRSRDNQLAPLKRGVAMLASMARCKVIPVHIAGAFDIWPRGQKIPKLRGKIVITFGKPLDWKEYEEKGLAKKELQALFTKDLEECMKGLGGKAGPQVKSI